MYPSKISVDIFLALNEILSQFYERKTNKLKEKHKIMKQFQSRVKELTRNGKG